MGLGRRPRRDLTARRAQILELVAAVRAREQVLPEGIRVGGIELAVLEPDQLFLAVTHVNAHFPKWPSTPASRSCFRRTVKP
jgi:hypothetical protein